MILWLNVERCPIWDTDSVARCKFLSLIGRLRGVISLIYIRSVSAFKARVVGSSPSRLTIHHQSLPRVLAFTLASCADSPWLRPIQDVHTLHHTLRRMIGVGPCADPPRIAPIAWRKSAASREGRSLE
jgi:hypothetical protein